MPRLSISSSSMISMARTLGAPETVPAGKAAISASIASRRGVELALDVGDDVHDVAVALDEELSVTSTRADFGDPADVVAAEVEQHQVLGALLGVGEQFRRRAPRPPGSRRAGGCRRWGGSSPCRRAPAPGSPGWSRRLEAAEIEEEQERRGIDPAQRAVKREGRQRERRREALRQHHLEDVAGADVFLRLLRPWRDIALRWCWTPARGSATAARPALSFVAQRAFEHGDRRFEPVQSGLVGRVGGDALQRPHRRDHGISSRTPSNTAISGRAHQQRIRDADRSGFGGASRSISRTMS